MSRDDLVKTNAGIVGLGGREIKRVAPKSIVDRGVATRST